MYGEINDIVIPNANAKNTNRKLAIVIIFLKGIIIINNYLMGSFGKFKALCIKNKNALILALPVTLSLACVIHLLIAFIIAKFTNTNFYFNTS
jgi:hypothetical protein